MISSVLYRTLTQTAIYWGTPVEDGYGGKTFATPVDIKCRWQDRVEKISRLGDRQGQEVVSNAQVFTLVDVQEQGWLYLGELDDFSAVPTDPKAVDGAYEIQRVDKTAAVQPITDFVRKAYL